MAPLHLARDSCVHCAGEGLRAAGRRANPAPCACVWRGVFRFCLHKYRSCVEHPDQRAHYGRSLRGTIMSGFPRAEYAADFTLVGLRLADPRLFRLHYLDGRNWRESTRELGVDRGFFFHACYRLEVALGRAMFALGLFPPDYFRGSFFRKMPQGGSAPQPPGFTAAMPYGRVRRRPGELRQCAPRARYSRNYTL